MHNSALPNGMVFELWHFSSAFSYPSPYTFKESLPMLYISAKPAKLEDTLLSCAVGTCVIRVWPKTILLCRITADSAFPELPCVSHRIRVITQAFIFHLSVTAGKSRSCGRNLGKRRIGCLIGVILVTIFKIRSSLRRIVFILAHNLKVQPIIVGMK